MRNKALVSKSRTTLPNQKQNLGLGIRLFTRGVLPFLALLIAISTFTANSAQADLQLYWDFEGDAADSSINGYDGTLVSVDATLPVYDASVPTALTGSTSSIALSGDDLVSATGATAWGGVGGTTSRTMSVWIKITDNSSLDQGIMAWGENATSKKWVFRTQDDNGPIDGNIRVEVSGGYNIGTTDVTDGSWHHVAATLTDDGSPNVTEVKLYVDGVLETISASQSTAVNTNGSYLDFFVGSDHSNKYLVGNMDDVAVYDQALNSTQIANLASGDRTPLTVLDVTDLFFDGGPTTTGTDWSTADNWTTDTKPTVNDRAYIGSAVQIATAGEKAMFVNVGHNNATLPGAGELTIAAGGDLTVEEITLGDGNDGILNLNGGTLTPVKINDGANNSTINMQGGTLNVGSLSIGTVDNLNIGTSTDAGSFTQSSGTIVVNSTMALADGNDGTYTLTGGTLSAGTITDGTGASTINLEGGTLTGVADITVDNFNINLQNPGGAVTYTRTGGTLTVNNNLQLGGETSAGGNHKGNLTQTGGNVIVGGDLLFGGVSSGSNEGGTYNLNGGTLTVTGSIVEGASGLPNSSIDSAQLQLNGGTLNVGGNITVQRFSVAEAGGSNATYTLPTTTTLTTTGTLSVAASGTGTLNLGDGTTVSPSDIRVGQYGSGTGIVNLSGGSISVGSNTYIGDAGRGTLNISGNGDYNLKNLIVGAQNNANSIGVVNIDLASSSDTVNTTKIQIGNGGKGTINLIEGTLISTTDIRLGDSGTSVGTRTATLNIGRAAKDTNPTLKLRGNLENGDNGDGVINMYSGTVTATGNYNWIIGQTSTGTAEFNMEGGEVDFVTNTGSNGILKANSGDGVVNMNDGTLRFQSIQGSDKDSGSTEYNFNGGTVIINKDLDYRNSTNANKTDEDTVNLAGATLDLTGGNIHFDNRTGVNEFNFTGGTLKDVNNFYGDLTQLNTDAASTLQIGADGAIDTMTINSGLTDLGNYTLTGGTLAIDISNAGNDRLIVGGSAAINGEIDVNLLGGFNPVAGSSFDVLDWTGAFSGTPTFDFTDAGLGSGLSWNTTNFGINGTLLVAANGNFWDDNYTASGTGGTGGNWSDTSWTTDGANGTAIPGGFADGGTPTFSAGTNGTGSFTVNVDTNANVNGITFQEGNITLADGGGVLTLTGASVDVATGTSSTIAAQLSGSAGLTKAGAGTLALTNLDNNYSGNTTINGGVLDLTNGQIYSGSAAYSDVVTVNAGGVLVVKNFGQNSNDSTSLGNLNNGAANVVLDGGTLRISGDTGANRGRAVTIGAGGGTIEVADGTFTMGSNSISNIYTAGSTLTLSGAGDGRMDKTISGTGVNLVKDGTGTWTIGVANTYTGTTTINDGTLATGAANLMPYGAGKGDVTINSPGVLNLDAGGVNLNGLWGDGTVEITGSTSRNLIVGHGNATSTFSGTIQNSGTGVINLTKTGTGTLTLSGNNSYSGETNLEQGTTVITNSNAFGNSSLVNMRTVGSGDTVLVLDADGLNIANDFFIRNPLGNRIIRLDRTGTNTGTLSGQFTINETTAGDFDIDVGANDTLTMSGLIRTTGGGGAGINKIGDGTLVLTNSNTYIGGTILNAGTLRGDTGTSFGSAGSTITLNGGTLQLASNVNDEDYNYNLNVVGTTVLQSLNRRHDLVGNITGAGTLNIDDGSIRFNGDMSGFTGTLQKNSDDELHLMINGGGYGNTATASGSASAAFVMNAGMMYLLNNEQSGTAYMGSLSGTGGTIYSKYSRSGDVTLEVGALGTNTTYSGRVADGNTGSTITALTKVGSGTLTLSGNNDYSGGTTVNGGTLQIGDGGTSGSIGTGTINVNNSTLALNRTDGVTLTGMDVNFNGSTSTATLHAIDGVNNIGAANSNLDVTGDVVWTVDSGATLNINVNTTAGDNVGFSGSTTLTLDGSGNGSIGRDIARGSASGTVIKNGTGTWTLSGAYAAGEGWSTGGLIINDGTLATGAAAVIPYGAGKGDVKINSQGVLDLTNGGVFINGLADGQAGGGTVEITGTSNRNLVLGHGDATATFSGTIQETGSGVINLQKNGAGTQTMTGTLTYGGTTTVTGGTLTFDTGGPVTLDEHLDLRNNTTFRVASGSVIVNDGSDGDTDALKTNTGGSNATTIQVDSGAFIEIADNIGMSQSSITFNGDGDSLISGSVASGGGGTGNGNRIIKNGTGTLTLTNDANNMNGTYEVNAGTMQVGVGGSGTINNAPVTVYGSGTLAGTGHVNSSVEVMGTVSPGDNNGTAVGTLHVGPTTFNAGSTLKIQLDPANAGSFTPTGWMDVSEAVASDTLDVTGLLDLGGATLDLRDPLSNGWARGQEFNILDFALDGNDLDGDGNIDTHFDEYLIPYLYGDGYATLSHDDLVESQFLPDLGETGEGVSAMLAWDFSDLYSQGIIRIVPEPSTWAIFALGLLAMGVIRRRKK